MSDPSEPAHTRDTGGVTTERPGVPAWLDSAVQYAWRGLVLVVAITAALVVLTRLYLVTLPVILALILATVCVPPARRLERHGVPRVLAALAVVVGGIGSVIGIIALLSPAFISEMRQLQPLVAEAVGNVLTWLEEGPVGWDRAQIEELFTGAMEQFEGTVGTIAAQVGSLALAVVEGITAIVLAVVLLFFFIKDGAQIVDWFISRSPAAHRDTVRAVGKRAWTALAGFVRGTALVALIDAIGIGVGLAILRAPLVLPLAVLVFFGGFVPVLGAFITGLLAVLVALAAGGWQLALAVLALVVIVQQIESNVLQPTIMRRAVALHPIVTLGVLMAGAVLIGIVGAFLAVPVAAVAAAVGNELRLRREREAQGEVLGPKPVAGPDIDPELLIPEYPDDTELRALRRRRRERAESRPRRIRTRGRNRRRAKLAATEEAADEASHSEPTEADVKADSDADPAGDIPRDG